MYTAYFLLGLFKRLEHIQWLLFSNGHKSVLV